MEVGGKLNVNGPSGSAHKETCVASHKAGEHEDLISATVNELCECIDLKYKV